MANKYQCPQCGAASSSRISATEYHCIYCESNFPVEVSNPEMITNFFRTSSNVSDEMKAKLAELRAKTTPEALAAMRAKAKRLALIIMISVFVFIGAIFSIVFSATKSSHNDSLSNGYWQDPTTSKFHVFSGSKGPVLWYILEQSGSHLDSSRNTLRIIDPIKNTTLAEFNFIPVMTWSDGFHSGDYIGDFYSFGDTCWNCSEKNGLVARNIYTGKVIIDGKQLGTMYPKLAGGISKASYSSYDGKFELTTNDGFDFYFSPQLKQVYTKDEWEKLDDDNSVTRTFFTLSDEKRPRLFVSSEKTSAHAYSSKVYSSDLENYTGKTRPDGLNDNVISLAQILPDITFFNGFIEYSDNDKTIVLYQSSIAKTSELHIACISKDGKILWNNSGKEVKDVFLETFSNNNRGIDFVYSKSALVLFYQYGDDNVMGLDWNTGKVLWSHTDKKK
jgi:hypothetical protein